MSGETYFRGQVVYRLEVDDDYPRVYMPNHPVAYESGIAYVHHIVAYEKWGDEIFDKHVHHKNGDKNDWRKENLELMEKRNHASKHASQKGVSEIRSCGKCGEDIEVTTKRRSNRDKVFCGKSCFREFNKKKKIDWPDISYLVSELEDRPFTDLGEELGVSDNAVRKHLERNGVDPKELV